MLRQWLSAWALGVSSQEKETKDTVLPSLCSLQQLSLCDGEELGLAGRGHTGISSILQPPYPQMSNCYMKMQGAVYLRYSAQNLYSQWVLQSVAERIRA